MRRKSTYGLTKTKYNRKNNLVLCLYHCWQRRMLFKHWRETPGWRKETLVSFSCVFFYLVSFLNLALTLSSVLIFLISSLGSCLCLQYLVLLSADRDFSRNVCVYVWFLLLSSNSLVNETTWPCQWSTNALLHTSIKDIGVSKFMSTRNWRRIERVSMDCD